MLFKILIMIFAAVFFSTFAFYMLLGNRLNAKGRIVKKRLDDLYTAPQDDESISSLLLKEKRASQIPFLNRILSGGIFTNRLHTLIAQSGSTVNPGTVVLGSLSLGGLGFLIILQLAHYFIPALVVAVFLGWLPYVYLRYKKNKRRDLFESQLPEALDMVTNALKSGFSFETALKIAAQEIPDPLGLEFATTFQEQNLGINFTEALMNFRQRMPSDDLNLFITALVIHKKTGGNLSEILDKTSSTIRDRFRLKREIKTKTAHGRFSGFVLVLLPLGVIGFMLVLNPDYFMTLINERAGNFMLGAAVIMQIVGIYFIRRIIDVKV